MHPIQNSQSGNETMVLLREIHKGIKTKTSLTQCGIG